MSPACEAWARKRAERTQLLADLDETLRPAKQGTVYKIVSPSGKGYVGQTVRKLAKRMDRHRDLKWGNCRLLKRAIRKYGWKAMQVRVLWQGPLAELNAAEIRLIAEHGTLAPQGYNALPGGDVNPMSTKAGRDAVRASWEDPVVRAKHAAGRKASWQDPVKRANHMAARDRRREAKLALLPPEEREKKRAKLKRCAEATARWKERQLTSSRSLPSVHAYDSEQEQRDDMDE